MKKKVYNFTVVIEKGEDGYYIAEVPSLRGCYTQGKTVEEAIKNIKEVIEMCLEDQEVSQNEFIGVQKVEVEK